MNEVYLTDLVVIPTKDVLMRYFNDNKYIYVSDIHDILSKKIIVRKIDNDLYQEIVTNRVFKCLPIYMLASFALDDVSEYVISPTEFGSRLDDSSLGYKIIKDYIMSHDSELYNKELDEFIFNAICFENDYVNESKKDKNEYKNATLKLLTLENKGK